MLSDPYEIDPSDVGTPNATFAGIETPFGTDRGAGLGVSLHEICLLCELRDNPLGHGVAVLAFELSKLGLFSPLGACHGHEQTDGDAWTRPRIWFSSESLHHIRVLADILADLKLQGHLAEAWRVVPSQAVSPGSGAAYCIEPMQVGVSDIAALHRDAATIGRHLAQSFAVHAARLADS